MMPVPPARHTVVPRTTLVAWTVLVTLLIVLAYLAQSTSDGREPGALYRWETAVGALIQYAVMLAIVLAVARRIAPSTLGLVKPAAPRRAAALAAIGLAAVLAVGWLLDHWLHAGDEQGLLPDGWDGSRAVPFLANALVVSIAAPVVEEVMYRGLGFAAVRDGIGAAWAIPITGLAFGLAHGLLVALPVLALFGVILGWLRRETGSIYPCIVLHATFNALALIAAVTVGTS